MLFEDDSTAVLQEIRHKYPTLTPLRLDLQCALTNLSCHHDFIAVLTLRYDVGLGDTILLAETLPVRWSGIRREEENSSSINDLEEERFPML